MIASPIIKTFNSFKSSIFFSNEMFDELIFDFVNFKYCFCLSLRFIDKSLIILLELNNLDLVK